MPRNLYNKSVKNLSNSLAGKLYINGGINYKIQRIEGVDNSLSKVRTICKDETGNEISFEDRPGDLIYKLYSN